MAIYEELSTSGVAAVAASHGWTEEEVAVRAAKQLLSDSRSWREVIRQHIFDFVVLFLVIPTPVLLYWFVAHQSFPHGKSQQVTVTRPDGIPAYHVIGDSDVTLATVTTVPGSLGKTSEVVGHYATQPLQRDTTVLSASLSSDTIAAGLLAGRHAMLIPIRAGSLPANARLPLHVALHVSSTKVPPIQPPLSIEDVYILEFKSVGETSMAMVAVKQCNLKPLTEWLGTSEVYISQVIR